MSNVSVWYSILWQNLASIIICFDLADQSNILSTLSKSITPFALNVKSFGNVKIGTLVSVRCVCLIFSLL